VEVRGTLLKTPFKLLNVCNRMLLVKDIYEDSKNMSKLKFTSNFVILSVFFIEKNYKLNF